MPTEIAHPFTVSENGGISATTNPDRQINQHVNTLLGTNPGERRAFFDYGIPAREMLFENNGNLVGNILVEQVRSKLEAYEPGVLVESIDVVPMDSGLGMANIEMQYTRREAPLSPSGIARNTNTAVVSVGGTVSEVVRG